MIFGINTTSDISKLLYVISRAVRRVKFETILKYHKRYLWQITRTRKGFVIFTCRYFKLSRNTTALSQSNCRNFSCSSIRSVKQQLAQPSSLKSDQHQFSLNNINLQYIIKRKVMGINMLETMSTLHEVVTAYLKIKGALSNRAHICYRFVMRSGFVRFQRRNNL